MSAREAPPPPSAPLATWTSLARAQVVAFVLARHGFDELASRIGLGALLARARNGPPDAAESRGRLGKRVARVLADLGPTYVKLGQMLATRDDVLPKEITTALGELHANAPPMAPRKVARAVRAALGEAPEKAFAEFELRPLAAASIGQVHRARLHSGEDVVVKVQRPGLRDQVRGDLAIMRVLAQLLAQRVPEIAAYDPRGLLEAFERSLEAELDYRREAENARELAARLEGAKEVRVPRVYRAYETMMVMERIEGRTLASLPDGERRGVRARLLRAFVRQVLEHGIFHADPHPGNVLVERGGRIVLLDLGAVERLDAALRSRLFRLVVAVALRRRRMLADAVVSLSVVEAGASRDAARLDADVATIVDAAATGADGAKMAERLIAASRAHGLRMPPALLGLARALAILDGVLRGLDPGANVVRDLRVEVARAGVRAAWARVAAAMVAARAMLVVVIAWMVASVKRPRALARGSHASLSDE